MNSVDVAQIVSAVAVTIATGMAAYTTHLILKQMRYQFSPNLNIATESFQIRISNRSIEGLFWEPPTDEGRYVNGGSTDYRFRLTNTGAGAAQEVYIHADFDLEAIYREIFSKLAEYAPNIDVSQDSWGTKIFVDGKNTGGFRNPDQSFGFIDYVRPAKGERVEEPFTIDPTLSFFATVSGFYLMKEKSGRGIAQPEQAVDVDFVIRCNDAVGKKIEKRLPYQLVISGGRWKSDETDGVCIVNLRRR